MNALDNGGHYKKFGDTIGQELLYTADTYYGAVLKEKGIPIPVLPKDDVIARGMEMAKQLAEKPRDSLTLLKAHLTKQIKKDLPDIIDAELNMHALTFTQPDVKERIDTLFGQ